MEERILFLSTDQLENFIKMQEKQGFRKSHTATSAGYISRKIIGYAVAYSGRYGIGFAIHTPRTDTTGFHDITYIVKPRIFKSYSEAV